MRNLQSTSEFFEEFLEATRGTLKCTRVAMNVEKSTVAVSVKEIPIDGFDARHFCSDESSFIDSITSSKSPTAGATNVMHENRYACSTVNAGGEILLFAFAKSRNKILRLSEENFLLSGMTDCGRRLLLPYK
jgi:hypothetical protein